MTDFLQLGYEPRFDERTFAAAHGVTLPEYMPREYLHIGTVPPHDGRGSIKVEVLAAPARFFRFTVQSAETAHEYEFETGSGTLDEYLRIVQQVALGMFVPTAIRAREEQVDAPV